MDVCTNNFRQFLSENSGYSFYNPYRDNMDDEKVDKTPKMVSDVTSGSLYKQKKAYSTPCTEVVKTGKGYSVYALKDFRRSDIIEIAPSIMQGSDAYGLDTLKDILFQIDKDGGLYALVLGNGSLYTYSDKPNVDFAWNKKTQCMYFVANRNIKRGEELTIDYGDEYWTERMPSELSYDSGQADIANQNVGEILSKVLYNKSIRG